MVSPRDWMQSAWARPASSTDAAFAQHFLLRSVVRHRVKHLKYRRLGKITLRRLQSSRVSSATPAEVLLSFVFPLLRPCTASVLGDSPFPGFVFFLSIAGRTQLSVQCRTSHCHQVPTATEDYIPSEILLHCIGARRSHLTVDAATRNHRHEMCIVRMTGARQRSGNILC